MFNLADYQTRDRQSQGAVFLLPGIEGWNILHDRFVKGLVDADVPYCFQKFDWPRKVMAIPLLPYNLRSHVCHHAGSSALREAILEYQARWPHRPVYLIGHSGGTGIIVETLERLPIDHSVAGVILLASALSTDYPLRSALQHVERKIWNFTSWGDFVFLGVLTSACGSYDGRYGTAAGLSGFSCRGLEPEECSRYEHLPYRMRYLRDYHYSGHFGCLTKRFARNQIAPLLRGCQSPMPEFCDEETSRMLESTIREGRWNPGVTRTG